MASSNKYQFVTRAVATLVIDLLLEHSKGEEEFFAPFPVESGWRYLARVNVVLCAYLAMSNTDAGCRLHRLFHPSVWRAVDAINAGQLARIEVSPHVRKLYRTYFAGFVADFSRKQAA